MSNLPGMDAITAGPWMVFELDNQHYAVPLSQVSEVIRDITPTPVPGSANDLLGVCHFRGNIVPVMDGRRRLGLVDTAAPDASAVRIIVFMHEGHRVGLRVDAVGELLRPQADAITPPPVHAGRVDDPVHAVAASQGSFVALLDVVRLCRLDPELPRVA